MNVQISKLFMRSPWRVARARIFDKIGLTKLLAKVNVFLPISVGTRVRIPLVLDPKTGLCSTTIHNTEITYFPATGIIQSRWLGGDGTSPIDGYVVTAVKGSE